MGKRPVKHEAVIDAIIEAADPEEVVGIRQIAWFLGTTPIIAARWIRDEGLPVTLKTVDGSPQHHAKIKDLQDWVGRDQRFQKIKRSPAGKVRQDTLMQSIQHEREVQALELITRLPPDLITEALTLFAAVVPSRAALQLFSERYPDRWAYAFSSLYKLKFPEPIKVEVEGQIDIRNASDLELAMKLKEKRKEADVIDLLPEILRKELPA